MMAMETENNRLDQALICFNLVEKLLEGFTNASDAMVFKEHGARDLEQEYGWEEVQAGLGQLVNFLVGPSSES